MHFVVCFAAVSHHCFNPYFGFRITNRKTPHTISHLVQIWGESESKFRSRRLKNATDSLCALTLAIVLSSTCDSFHAASIAGLVSVRCRK